jgi:GT2 family glycosyltransferase
MSTAGVRRATAATDCMISVVVCTTARRHTLWPLLEELVALDDLRFEVLVVENNPTSRLDPDRLASLGVRHVVEPRRGLDVARNRGWAEAAGEVIAYVDDDCSVSPKWLHGLRCAFGDPTVALVTGRVLAAALGRASEVVFEAAFPWDRGTLPIEFARVDAERWFPASTHHLGTGCNMAFRRSALERLGGFDEALDMGTLIGGGGDLDAFARVIDAGMEARYEPSAIVLHHHRVTMRDLRWQVWGYGVAQGALLTKGLLTRPGRRPAIVRFWCHRVATKWRELSVRVRQREGFPRSVLLLETIGLLVGPFVYPVSAVQRWLRRLRR